CESHRCVGLETMEFIYDEVKGGSVFQWCVCTFYRGLLKLSHQECAEELCSFCANNAFWQAGNEDALVVHECSDVEAVLHLPEDVSCYGVYEECAEFVLQGSNSLEGKHFHPCLKFVKPEYPYNWIAGLFEQGMAIVSVNEHS